MRPRAAGNRLTFRIPLPVTAGTTYVASYHTDGNYSADPNFFATDYTNGPLTAPSSASERRKRRLCVWQQQPISRPTASMQPAMVSTSFLGPSWRRRRQGSIIMHSELYTDGISEITVSGSVVRVDLVSLSPTERDANNKPKKVFRQRLIFSVEAFANSVEIMNKALQGLADAGVVKRVQPKAQKPKSDSQRTGVSFQCRQIRRRAPNVSTNFR